MVFGVVTADGDVAPPFISHWPQTPHKGIHQELGRVSAALNRDDGRWKTLHLETVL